MPRWQSVAGWFHIQGVLTSIITVMEYYCTLDMAAALALSTREQVPKKRVWRKVRLEREMNELENMENERLSVSWNAQPKEKEWRHRPKRERDPSEWIPVKWWLNSSQLVENRGGCARGDKATLSKGRWQTIKENFLPVEEDGWMIRRWEGQSGPLHQNRWRFFFFSTIFWLKRLATDRKFSSVA